MGLALSVGQRLKQPRYIVMIAVVLVASGIAFAAQVVANANPADSAETQMSVPQAVILGIVEGLTEYLPVSSTGHILVTQKAMGIGNGDGAEAANAFAICIQLGAILAVFSLYIGRIKQMSLGLLNQDRHGQRILFNILVAFLPAAIVGLLFDKVIEEYLFGLWPIIGAWFVGGAAILILAWTGKERFPPEGNDLEHLTRNRALLIGLIQCIAMWPGVSRSLVTIVGGVLVGLSLPAAVEFSFLLGLLTLTAATGYKALEYGPEMIQQYGLTSMIAGSLAAMISAVIAVKWMVAYLNKHGLSIFGYYRVGIAIIVGILVVSGVISSD